VCVYPHPPHSLPSPTRPSTPPPTQTAPASSTPSEPPHSHTNAKDASHRPPPRLARDSPAKNSKGLSPTPTLCVQLWYKRERANDRHRNR
jgi:hypothetical protein